MYLWFHAFHRDAVGDTLEVLRTGPRVHPSPSTRTKENEAELGIDPPCVYAYLGRTLEVFGSSAICLPMADVSGTVSPFDTGGLVEHIEPVHTWESEARRAYLQKFSWECSQLATLLKRHPTALPAKISAYLRGRKPDESGPHEVWTTADANCVAAIWSGDDWRAWTWETRVPQHIPVNHNVVRWSCSSATYGEILRYAESVTDPNEGVWLESLLQRLVVGTSSLVSQLIGHQEAA
jgi:hypothetical protein